MKKLLALLAFVILFFQSFSQSLDSKTQYPDTRKDNTVDNYFGTNVSDPYRWLEDDNSAETKAWVQDENKVTFDYLAKIPYREDIRKRITELYNYPRMSTPYRQGNYYFYTKNDGLQPQSVLYYQQGIDANPQVFIDPNAMNAKGTTAVSLIGFSNDRKYVAYSVAESGSDWQTIYVKDIAANKQLTDKLEWTKFSGAAWYRDGFYYSGYDTPEKGKELTAQSQYQKVYYHKLGDSQSSDRVVWADYEHPLRYVGAQTTEDEKFLILTTTEGTDGTEIWYMDLRDQHNGFKKILEGFQYNYTVLDDEGENLMVFTNNGAKNYDVVMINPKNPSKENWKSLIPEKQELLQNVNVVGGKLICEYLKDASTHLFQFDRKGTMEREINLPIIGTANGFWW
jgi:prolyl oligopeptidase